MKQRRLLIDVVPTKQRSRLVPDGKVLPPQVRILLLVTEKRKSNIETLVSQILATAEPKTPGDISFERRVYVSVLRQKSATKRLRETLVPVGTQNGAEGRFDQGND